MQDNKLQKGDLILMHLPPKHDIYASDHIIVEFIRDTPKYIHFNNLNDDQTDWRNQSINEKGSCMFKKRFFIKKVSSYEYKEFLDKLGKTKYTESNDKRKEKIQKS